jgi:excisionase family DNA binding protein
VTELLRPREVAAVAHAPRDLVYAALKSGQLKSIKRGSRFLVPSWAVEEWIREEVTNGSGNTTAPGPTESRVR